jgi:hypothetical protein
VTLRSLGHFDYGWLQMDVVFWEDADAFELSFSLPILLE